MLLKSTTLYRKEKPLELFTVSMPLYAFVTLNAGANLDDTGMCHKTPKMIKTMIQSNPMQFVKFAECCFWVGLAASEEYLKKANSAAEEIEAVGRPVDLSVDLDKL